jgi:hypothetical protein
LSFQATSLVSDGACDICIITIVFCRWQYTSDRTVFPGAE